MSSEVVKESYDIVVIGAGPAGISAALTAFDSGARVLLLDEQPVAGGQIYRQLRSADSSLGQVLGEEYLAGKELLNRFHNAGLERIHSACVWRIDPEGQVVFSVDGQASSVTTRHLIVATGALERAVPVPGWHLHGVMGVGAGQVLLKGQGMIPEKTVLAGSGPLLYLYACQLIRAGAPPLALLETQTISDWRRAAPHSLAFMANPKLVFKGLRFLREIRRAKVPRYRSVRALNILGKNRVEGISFRTNRESVSIAASTVLLHQGVIPNTQITRSLRVEHVWNHLQKCFQPVTDSLGFTSHPKVSLAGDGGGIIGAEAAETSGELAALGALRRLNLIVGTTLDKRVKKLQHYLNRTRRSRMFLDSLYSIPNSMMVPSDDVVVCRCERVLASTVKQAVQNGCVGPNQAKAFHRCGMGPCQGRYCGLTVTSMIANATSQSASETGYYTIRPPLKPISLGELGSLDSGPHEPAH